MLQELDRLHLAGTFAIELIKKFHFRQELCLNRNPNIHQKEVPQLQNFLTNNYDSDFFDPFNNFSEF